LSLPQAWLSAFLLNGSHSPERVDIAWLGAGFRPTTITKDQPFIRLVFFAYSRVFARISADSCGLRGFMKFPKFAHFSLFALLFSPPLAVIQVQSPQTCIFYYKNQ
jgi:hypothetical protein